MKYCSLCNKCIDDKEVVRRSERTEQHQTELEQFFSQVHGGAAAPANEVREYHIRTEIQGQKRKGVIGGFRPRQVRCGPLRDATPEEVSECIACSRAFAAMR